MAARHDHGGPMGATELSPQELHQRYEAERNKRIGAGVRDYVDLIDIADSAFDRDPYSEPFERAPVVEQTDVVIVGAGWSGLTAAIGLGDNGVTDYRIIDKAGDVGGTWYWNRYPGCQCDVESYTYLPLLERTGYMPTQKYATAPEIFGYAQLLARTFDIYPHALFQTSVTGMRWSEELQRWRVTTTRDDVIDARFVVICGGVLHVAKLPAIPGVYDFRGPTFHTARWDYEVTGGSPTERMDRLGDKVVGIVGTGATAIQAVPKLAEAAKHLYVFQRTPSTVSPRNQQPTDPEWFAEMSSKPGWHDERMENFINATIGAQPDVDLVQDGWTRLFWIDPKGRARDEEEARRFAEWDDARMAEIRQRVLDTVEDPQTAQKLLPWYKLWCKRPCFHDEYLPTFNRPNVTLVDTDGRGVDRVTERGVVAGDEEYPLDVLIYSTGFDLSSPYHHRLGFDPVGRDGKSLSESWAKGMYSLHGVLSHGFPNLCMNQALQGGQHINIAYPATKTSEHIAWVIGQCLKRNVMIEPEITAEDEWFEWVRQYTPWYVGYLSTCTPGVYNGELKGGNESQSRSSAYMGSAVEFKRRLEAWRTAGTFDGVVLTPYDR
jgi:cation diffusion facilitator CzcD-associated flavoprotein CzcO